jgi:glycerol-3-phosphate acyltransferase PlsY
MSFDLNILLLIILSFSLSYIVGSFTFGYFAVKFFHGVDLRDVGSKNVGATNVWRNGYKVLAIFTFIFDALKALIAGYLSVLSLYFFDPYFTIEQTHFLRTYLPISCAGTAVIGHLYSLFLCFKGGKGISSFFGFLLFGFPNLFIFSGILWGAVFALKRISSLASLSSVSLCILYVIFFPEENFLRFLIMLLSLLIIFAHRENIKNLIKKNPKEIMKKK